MISGILLATLVSAAGAGTNDPTVGVLSTSFANRTFLVGTNAVTLAFTWHAGDYMCQRMTDIYLESSKVQGFINWSHARGLRPQDMEALFTAIRHDIKETLATNGLNETAIAIPAYTKKKE